MKLLLLFFVFMPLLLVSCGGSKRVFLHADSAAIYNINYSHIDSIKLK